MRMNTLRMLAIGVGVVLTALAADTRAGSAQRGYDNNWCISNGLHGGGSMDCTYSTFQQCLASRSGNGGLCEQNPSRLQERAGRTRSNQRDRW